MNQPLSGIPAARPRVLFVDDEVRILVALKAMFRNDYEVRTADSGRLAIETLRNWPADVIVSDQRMPGMTGVEVLRAALEVCPSATRVLLTGYSDLDAIVGSINEGEVFRYVAKPWSNAELRETLAAAVRASGLHVGASVALAEAGAALPSAQPGVLVLDADARGRELIVRLLGKDRPVYVSASADEALALLARHRIGILISDAFVDGEIATTLVSALRQQHPSLVVIVLAEEADAQHSIELINHGQVYRLLRKPVSEGVLRGSVNLADRRAEFLRQHPEQARRITLELVPLPPARQNTGLLSRIRRLLVPG